ncbi:XrtA/PEP-CTERM system TPR-repeat protein PrsT [Methyloversatilis thermotolerans]|uniref:XrtA/PEP-CTERM system TPR-repeat protein PrsT n=1 Tax=Methyloversatilis thermotolerans TaxID=1346290 RepID=UPI0003775FA1|nr:XrtA/PEP-CTERM system TPR-repeat protein PrsT [Methyloversatilis thermotolerans]
MFRPTPLWLGALALAFTLSCTPVQAAADAGRYYEDALVRFEKKDDAGAIIQLKNALKADPGFLAAHLLMGRASLRKGDYASAEVALREAQRLGVAPAEIAEPLAQLLLDSGRQKELLSQVTPDDLPPAVRLEVLMLRARAQTELNLFAQARESLAQARSVAPESVAVVALQANVELQAGQGEAAARLAETATSMRPDSSEAWTARASVAYARGDLDRSLDFYSRAVGAEPKNGEALLGKASVLMDLLRTDEAAVVLKQLAEADPREPRGAYLRAVLAIQKGDVPGARKLLAEVVNLIDPAPRGALTSRAHLALIAGLAHYELGAVSKAKEYFELYMRFFPANGAVRKPLAAIYLAERNPARALTLLEPALRDSPRDVDVIMLNASAQAALGRHQRATELYEQAARLRDTAGTRTALGLSMLGAGQRSLGVAELETALKKSPGDFRASTVLALDALRSGRPQRAVDLMETVLKRSPDNLSALHLRAVARAAAGDAKGARADYQKVLDKDPSFRVARLNLVKLDVAERKYDSARQRLDALLKANPDDVAALFELARLQSVQGQSAQAVATLERLLAKSEGNEQAVMELVSLHLAARRNDEALTVAKNASANNPDSIPFQLALARVQLARGENSAARGTLASATRGAGFSASSQAAIGRLQLEAGNLDGAEYSAQKALQGSADHLPAQLLAMEVDIAAGRLDKAEARLKPLLQSKGNVWSVQRLAGDLALARGQSQGAAGYYAKALDLEHDFETLRRLYIVQRKTGEAAKALSRLEAAGRKRPDDVAVQLLLAEAQAAAGRKQAARETLLATAAHADDPVVLNNLANIQADLGDPAALATAERAWKKAPNDPVVLDTYGWLLVQAAQIDQGLKILREARLRDLSNPEIRFHLAVALSKSGRVAEARSELAEALASKRDFAGRADALALQKSLSAR